MRHVFTSRPSYALSLRLLGVLKGRRYQALQFGCAKHAVEVSLSYRGYHLIEFTAIVEHFVPPALPGIGPAEHVGLVEVRKS